MAAEVTDWREDPEHPGFVTRTETWKSDDPECPFAMFEWSAEPVMFVRRVWAPEPPGSGWRR